MWTLFKRGRVWWAEQTINGARDRKTTRCTDRKAAELTVRQWERADADPRHQAAYTTTLRSALDRLIVDREVIRKRAKGTVTMYEQKAAHVARVLGPETMLADIGAPDVDHFIDTRLDEGAHRNTIGKELTTLRATLKIAKRRGEFIKDVSDVMPIGWSNNYEPRKTFLTPEQLGALFDEVAFDYRKKRRELLDRVGHLAFIVATGMRDSEAAAAERQDVDMLNWTVLVRGTKTRDSAAVIAVSPLGRALLQMALDMAPGGKIGPLFREWGNMRRDLAEACQRAGVPRVSANDLRRTCATWLAQQGASLFAISKVLRHRDTRMVERVYAQLAGRDLRATLEREVGTTPVTVTMACQTPAQFTESADPTDAGPSQFSVYPCPRMESNHRHADFQSGGAWRFEPVNTGASCSWATSSVPMVCRKRAAVRWPDGAGAVLQ